MLKGNRFVRNLEKKYYNRKHAENLHNLCSLYVICFSKVIQTLMFKPFPCISCRLLKIWLVLQRNSEIILTTFLNFKCETSFVYFNTIWVKTRTKIFFASSIPIEAFYSASVCIFASVPRVSQVKQYQFILYNCPWSQNKEQELFF